MSKEEVLPLTKIKKSRFFYGYVIIAATFFIMVIIGGTQYTFGVFFKPLASDFGWTSAITSGPFALYMVIHGILYIVTGRLNDRFGPRLVVTGTSFLLGLGFILMSRTSAIWHVYLFYGGLISFGMSGAFVPLTSTVARWFIKKRGLMTGVAIAGIGAGTMIMPPLTSWLIANYGWRNSYIAIGVIVWVVILSSAQFLRRDPVQKRQLPYGYNEVQAKRAKLEVEGFSVQEAIRTRQFWLFCLAYLNFGLFLQAVMVHVVPSAIEMGITPTSAATIFIALGGPGIIGRIVCGITGDRIGNRAVATICFAMTTASLAFLLVAREMWMFYIFAIVFGFSYGGLVTMISPLIADIFGLRSHGVIMGIIAFILTIGGAIGPVLAGVISDISGDYFTAFLICCILSLISFISLIISTLWSNKTDNSKRVG